MCSANKCASFVTWGTAWQNSAGYHNTVNVSLQNKGSGAINIPYNVTLTAPGYTKLDQVSNMWHVEALSLCMIHSLSAWSGCTAQADAQHMTASGKHP